MGIESENNQKVEIEITELETTPDGKTTYTAEHDEIYFPNQKERIDKYGEEHKGEKLPMYISLEDEDVTLKGDREDFKGVKIHFDKEGKPQMLEFNDEIDLMVQSKKEATVDPLTGLENRNGWEKGLEKLAEDIQRGNLNDKHMTIAIYDLNNLKEINDKHGHQKGDESLKMLAELLNDTFRKTDPLARLGGDEFGSVAISDKYFAQKLKDRLLEYKKEGFDFCAGIYSFSVNDILSEVSNISDYSEKLRKIKEILKENIAITDQTLYQAKHSAAQAEKEGPKPTRVFVKNKGFTDTSQ